eukprot:TRINITY_DN1033_c1_g2_i1.p1 TRINITY_DN1033_c1_g2~~TRINITY_DN1033_c1_g2_i1.p1  ORF type:complete len:416 (+),score=119.00 TRINITY_DN1033_c1_g2_i1:106-1353(+)
MSFECHGVRGELGRIGTLSLHAAAPVRTPALFVDTRRLAIPHISHDIWEELVHTMTTHGSNVVLSVNVFDFLESVPVAALAEMEREDPPPPPPSSSSSSSESDRVRGHESRGTISLHKFTGFSNVPILLHVVDPSTPSPATPSSSKTMCSQREVGRMTMSMNEFVDCVRLVHPAMVVLPHDIGSMIAEKKRLDRSYGWEEECQSKIKGIDGHHDVMMIGAVRPSPKTLEKRAAAIASECGGLFWSTLSQEMGYTWDERMKSLKTSLERYSDRNDLLHICMCGGSMEEVITLISMGVDAIQTMIPFEMAENGFCFAWDFESFDAPAWINLRDPSFLLDTRPLREGCSCPACRRHTRAYVHHLLNTHEMLASTLLSICNLWNYVRLFDYMRNLMENETEKREWELFVRRARALSSPE